MTRHPCHAELDPASMDRGGQARNDCIGKQPRKKSKRIGRKDGGQYVREQFERRIFPCLGHTAVADVCKADVLAVLDAVKAEGKLRTVNMLLADLKQMFRFAAEREIIEHSPIELIQKKKIGGKDTRRERVLSGDELTALVKKLTTANLNRRTVLGLWLILATGCRIGELMGATWADAKPHQRTLQTVVDAHNVAHKSGAVQLGFIDTAERTWYLGAGTDFVVVEPGVQLRQIKFVIDQIVQCEREAARHDLFG